MKKSITLMLLMFLALSVEAARETIYHPWDNGKLVVSKNSRYLVHENGTPFFWLGNTSWLLPERLNRDEVGYYLGLERKAGYNVEQIQVLNGIPTFTLVIFAFLLFFIILDTTLVGSYFIHSNPESIKEAETVFNNINGDLIEYTASILAFVFFNFMTWLRLRETEA